MKIKFSRQIFGKLKYTKFHENPSSGSLVAPCEKTDDLHTDLTKFFAILRHTPKNPPFIQPTAEVFRSALQIY